MMQASCILRRVTPSGVGEVVGRAAFVDTPHGLAARIVVPALPPGDYGMHVHERGLCGPGWSDADQRVIPAGAAGPHFDPSKSKSHRGPGGGGHAGDLPRLRVRGRRGADQRFTMHGVSVQDVIGRSLIVHVGGDNYADTPLPNGGAGARQLCGAIEAVHVAGSRYPGVTSASLPEKGVVAHTQRQEERPYLCVAYDTEQASIQPLRLAAGLVAAPMVGYGAWQLRQDHPVLAAGLATVAASMGAWSLFVWSKADTEMRRGSAP